MMSDIKRRILAIGILVLVFGSVGLTSLIGSMPVVAAEVTIYVDASNTDPPWLGTFDDPFQFIQDGINNAGDGDTVYVFGGTYNENVVANKSVTLTGESKPVLDGMGGMGPRGIDITANNVTVEGFNITNSVFGIYCNASGFSIINNIFWYDNQGFYWNIHESNLAADYTVYGCVVENNEFYMNSANHAVRAIVALDYNYTGFYDVEIGDIQISNNTFHMEGTIATGIEIDDIYVQHLYGGTVSFGVLNISENSIYGGDYGIDFYGDLEDLQDVQASVGDVIIKNNVMVNQSSYGMTVDYYDGTYWNGSTVGTYGDLIITGNTITSVYDAEGIYLSDIGYWHDFYDNASLEVGNVYIEENEIDVGGYGIYFYGYEVGYDMYDNSSFTMGHISVKNNVIDSGSEGIYVDFYEFGNYMNGTSSVTIGNIEFSENVINSTSYGIYLYEFYDFGYEMYDEASFTMGDILVNNNKITSDQEGIYVDYINYFGNYMYGTSSFTMGKIEFSGNVVNSGDDGIYVDKFYEFGYYMYDNSSFTMGDILVNNNTINSGSEGIYVEYFDYFGNYMYGSSSFTMDNIELCRNTINSTYEGIYIYEFYEFGYDMYENASFTMGDILVSGNLIHSDDKGIYAYDFEYFGEDLYDNSTWTMGNIQFNSNTIHSVGEGIYVYYFTYFGDYMAGNASFMMGNIEFSGNTINSTLDGIYFYNIYDIAEDMYGNSTFTMGDFSVNDNVITNGNDGIQLDYLEPFGITAYENATFTMDLIEFSGNTISNCNTGMNFTDLLNATITNNIIQDCSYGIYLLNSNNSIIYHNTFNNTINAYDNGTNTWDNGYPSGGNYWSDYNGTDLFSGPGQNIAGSDGIGDTQYDIEMDNQDRYPFMSPFAWDETPPSISDVTQEPQIPDDLETVTITAVVTDTESGVYNVTLSYSTDGGENWTNVTMQETAGDTYQGQIPGLPVETQVQYKIIAYDNIGNSAVEDNAGEYYVYTVIPEFPTAIILPLFTFLALIAVALAKGIRRKAVAKTL